MTFIYQLFRHIRCFEENCINYVNCLLGCCNLVIYDHIKTDINNNIDVIRKDILTKHKKKINNLIKDKYHSNISDNRLYNKSNYTNTGTDYNHRNQFLNVTDIDFNDTNKIILINSSRYDLPYNTI